MAINATKEDENTLQRGKLETLKRLSSYLMVYKGSVIFVFFLLAYSMFAGLINPTVMELSIDRYIKNGDLDGLYQLAIAVTIMNLLVVLSDKIRMYVMAKVCNGVLVNIRQELYSHI